MIMMMVGRIIMQKRNVVDKDNDKKKKHTHNY